jgi:hypothetical protein
MKLKPLELVGIGALVYFVGQYLASNIASKLVIGQISFSNLGSSFTGLNLRINIPILNQSAVPLPIDQFFGGLYYGDQYKLADLAIPTGLTIVPGEQIILPIDTYVDYASLSGQLVDIFQTGNFLNALKVKGNLQSSGLTIPINQNLQLA